MINALNDMLFADTSAPLIQLMGKFPENPNLEQKRIEARRRMREEFNRKDLLSGGNFNRRNTVLPQVAR